MSYIWAAICPPAAESLNDPWYITFFASRDMWVPNFSLAKATPCWNPQLNFCTGGISIPPINPNWPSLSCNAVATPAIKPACSSAKNIETVFSDTSGFASLAPEWGAASNNTNLASLYFSCPLYIAVSNLNPGVTINLNPAS